MCACPTVALEATQNHPNPERKTPGQHSPTDFSRVSLLRPSFHHHNLPQRGPAAETRGCQRPCRRPEAHPRRGTAAPSSSSRREGAATATSPGARTSGPAAPHATSPGCPALRLPPTRHPSRSSLPSAAPRSAAAPGPAPPYLAAPRRPRTPSAAGAAPPHGHSTGPLRRHLGPSGSEFRRRRRVTPRRAMTPRRVRGPAPSSACLCFSPGSSPLPAGTSAFL